MEYPSFLKSQALMYVLAFLVGILASAATYLGIRMRDFHLEALQLSADLAATTQSNAVAITSLETKLATETESRISVEGQLAQEKNHADVLAAKAQDSASAAAFLQKRIDTDPQLLQKYSKVYFLNENYVPKVLTKISPDYTYEKGRTLEIESRVEPKLEALLTAAHDTTLNLQIISAYRSFGTQAALKSSYRVTYGAGTANAFSADQGYSEHQLGTAIDFTTLTVGTSFKGFENTPEYEWLLTNAWEYGFILSYPAKNSYYQYEPWHWRFVGVPLATKLHENEQYFYELDQREIDGYLGTLFD